MDRRTFWQAMLGLALVAAFLALTPHALSADADPNQPTSTGIELELAPRRAQVLNVMAARFMRANGIPVPSVPTLYVVDQASWERLMPRLAVAYAAPEGIVIGPSAQVELSSSWPPNPESAKIVLHELGHLLRATPGHAYRSWSLRTRAVEEATVDAVADDLLERFLLKHWKIGPWQYLAATGYPSCSRMVRRVSARATGQRIDSRAARSFRLALLRAPIETAQAALEAKATAQELAACDREVRDGVS